MKKVYAIAMLAILVVNSAGFYMYYAVQLQQIRAEMRHALIFLPEDQLDVLTFTSAEFEDAKQDDHEVSVHGKMYDIARVEFSGDKVIVYCLHDEKEDNLFSLLSEVISKPLKDKSSMPSTIVHFLTLTFITPRNNFSFSRSSQNDIVTFYHFSIQAATLAHDSPPPQNLPA